MKTITQKSLILILSILCFVNIATAKNFYVDPVSGLDTNDGLSWDTAVQTISKATTLAAANSGVDDILIKGGSDIAYTINFASGVSTSTFGITDNYYGSCKGDETSPSQRPLTDRDGNGIIESWEFQYPTTLSSTYSGGTAFTIGTPYQFNGFTITHTGTSTSTAIARTVAISSNLGVFANNIITGCNLNVSGTGATNTYGILFKALGRVQNCLIEKNQISVSFTANISCYPIMEVAASGTSTIGTKVLNSIIRNNKVTLDYTACSTVGTLNSNAKGLMMNITPGTSGMGYTVVNNCLIHNNEMTYTPHATNTPAALTVGAPLYIGGAANTTDSIVNCTVANNKGTKIYYAGINIKNSTGSNFILNNVFWNNQNDAVVSNIYSDTPPATSLISNNFSNGGSSLTNNGTAIIVNDNTLGNTGNLPNFLTPTTSVGVTTDNSTELSDWSLTSGSYLIGKGVTISVLNSYYNKDKAGASFSSARAVGAYEYFEKTTPVIIWSQNLAGLKINSSTVLTPTTSAGTNAPAITYTIGNPSVVTLNGSSITTVGLGTTTITANQAANKYYNAAAPVTKTITVSNTETIVSNISQLNAAIATTKPGDVIIMQDGMWTNTTINFNSVATATNPITLRAQTSGNVTLNGSSTLTFANPNLIVDGLYFNQGAITRGSVIYFNADSCLLSNTAILNYNPDTASIAYYWAFFNGSYNRMSQCYFKGKNNGEPTIGNASSNARHNSVDHCYFTDIPYSAEIFRIWGYGGNEELGNDGAYFTIENNLFEQIVGDNAEIISFKSNYNIARYNTIKSSVGAIVGRSGNYNTIEGNFIFGQNTNGSKGIRVAGQSHRVVNNYISDVSGTGIVLMTGEYIDTYLTPSYTPILRAGTTLGRVPKYGQVKNGVFAHNTIINSSGAGIEIGNSYKSGWSTNQMVLLPENNQFINNLVLNSKYYSITFPVQDTSAPLDFLTFLPNNFSGNIVYGGSLVISPAPSGITTINPLFSLGTDGLYRPSSNSPVIDAGAASDVTIDMDGQTRNSMKDVGADEYSTASIVLRPLTPSDVGPTWMLNSLMTNTSINKSTSDISILENPKIRTINIKFSVKESGKVICELYDMMGRLCKVFLNSQLSSGDYNFTFSSSSLQTGIYLCRLKTLSGNKTAKFLLKY